jgi:hypothetical protein
LSLSPGSHRRLGSREDNKRAREGASGNSRVNQVTLTLLLLMITVLLHLVLSYCCCCWFSCYTAGTTASAALISGSTVTSHRATVVSRQTCSCAISMKVALLQLQC